MARQGVDPLLLNAWLSARSIARGLPMPVPEYGGFRIDTNSNGEIARWVFPKPEPGLQTLRRIINEPGYLMKLCGSADELDTLLPVRWTDASLPWLLHARAGRATREQADVFICDRIVTQPGHGRKGLAQVLMAELSAARQVDDKPQVLVATKPGRVLYTALGRETVSPYSTASITRP
ncbi:GNAT family N-acetyltransferase [Croceicoccus sp. YJ47]|uniref:GNAT family N-acetyltransferase n=1 Tax=Croceicoccus sp. YJ47 TaxID=2798724 RepID=UPI001920B1B4|nr:GNAT family N-acetyltransferase [Croceicoccus sp. YJ47]QQN74363.1 GNAT family N-acetyltransferase [Croceicoccus sp. YJ47]